MTADRHLELTLGATPAEVVRGCDAMRAFCRAHGLTDAVAFDAALVLEEVSSNVVNHGFAGARPGNVSVKAEILADTLRIEVQDDGPAFNPLAAPAPDMETYWSEARVGGLGLHIVRALAEGVEYTRRDQRNCLVLTLPLGSRS